MRARELASGRNAAPAFGGLRRTLCGVACIAMLAATVNAASASTSPRAGNVRSAGFSVLYAFGGGPGDGSYPQGGVYVDKAGRIFGVTTYGGNVAEGTLFELSAAGSQYAETLSYSLSCTVIGCYPTAPPLEDRQGNIFVVNSEGGEGPNASGGTVVEFSPNASTYAVNRLLVMSEPTGAEPNGLLAIGSEFYLSTIYGGSSSGGNGTILSLSHGLKPSLLYMFGVPSVTGQYPQSTLAVDADGALYGVTSSGGTTNSGTVFKLVPSPSGAVESVLWNFQSGDGTNPAAGLVLDAAGNIYGTARNSGRYNGGVVFKLSPVSGGYVETVLHAFAGGADGFYPSGPLVAKGNDLYGLTSDGGTGNCSDGCGTIYRVSNDGSHYAVVHTFAGLDGAFPFGALFLRDGGLFGTTTRGPAYGNGQTGNGLVFAFHP